jgi:hypothetical protein
MTMTMTSMTLTMMSSLSLLLLFLLPHSSQAVLPTAQIDLYDSSSSSSSNGKHQSSSSLLASHAWYGPRAPMANRNSRNGNGNGNSNGSRQTVLRLAPVSNPLLCDNSSSSTAMDESAFQDAIVLVPRGQCTYQTKTWVAQLGGAKGVIIYNTLQARYAMNMTNSTTKNSTTSTSEDDIEWPLDFHDYDCTRAQAQIPSDKLSFHPLPYNADHNNPLLTGTTNANLCRLYSTTNSKKGKGGKGDDHHDFDTSCPSHRCLLTGNKNTSTHQACCAWDLHLYLYPDGNHPVSITIPTVFVTMQQGEDLLSNLLLLQSSADDVLVTLSSRWQWDTNLSSGLIWMLGVAVAALAAYLSASDYHKGIQRHIQRQQRHDAQSATGNTSSRHPPRPPQQPLVQRSALQEETLELEPIHALGFVVMASSSLFILFYFKVRTDRQYEHCITLRVYIYNI